MEIHKKVDYDWIVVGSDQQPLAYKKPDSDPVFIDAEAAVLKCVEVISQMNQVNTNTQNLLADLSRLL
jgi:hypothetical protein